jgi:hypothetical protein
MWSRFALKGVAAYAYHAQIWTEDDRVYSFIEEALPGLSK